MALTSCLLQKMVAQSKPSRESCDMLQNRREAHARKEPKVREEDDEPDASACLTLWAESDQGLVNAVTQ